MQLKTAKNYNQNQKLLAMDQKISGQKQENMQKQK